MENLDYGIIGNCRTAALISKHGSIDWFCLPEFDSSSAFAKILDKNKGGSFRFITTDDFTITQSYIKNTNILCTHFDNGKDSFEVLDFMPRYQNNNGDFHFPPDLIRYIRWIKGKPEIRVDYQPKLEFAKYETKNVACAKYIKSSTVKGVYDSLYLYSNLNKEKILSGESIPLTQDAFFLISYNQKLKEQNIDRTYLKLERTKVYWLEWSNRTTKFAKYNQEVNRSALTLKLLSNDKSGAILAAATTSLPETIGEVRNWDYRFCWIRDASMVIKTIYQLGHKKITKRFLDFIIDVIPEKDEKIQIMYGIKGEKNLTEHILDHLSGYENSAPVRIGNAAYKQKQHDIYGILMDVIYEQVSNFETSLESSENLWTITRSIVRTVLNYWGKPDKGIWEIRTDEKHFTFSKVLCWVAIDRGIKVAELYNMHAYANEWKPYRETIKKDILEKAWNENKQSFTQHYDTNDLDASTLLMVNYGFIEAKDEKYISTVKAIQKELCHEGLMYRYKNQDDFGKPSSSFTICTFWLIHSLYLIGEKEEAIKLFDQLLSYSNHLGLFSEDIDFESKRLLGNFPQAYSHLALIETAITINKDLSSKHDQSFCCDQIS